MPPPIRPIVSISSRRTSKSLALRSVSGPIQSADLLQLIRDVEAIEQTPSIEEKNKKLEAKLKSVKAEAKTRMDWMLKNLAMDENMTLESISSPLRRLSRQI